MPTFTGGIENVNWMGKGQCHKSKPNSISGPGTLAGVPGRELGISLQLHKHPINDLSPSDRRL